MSDSNDPQSPKRVLTLLFDGVEEIEAVAPIDLLRRAQIEVTTASLGTERAVAGRSQIEILADAMIGDVRTSEFDALFLPGGPGVLKLIGNPSIEELISYFARSGKLIAAICAAPKVLASMGLLEERLATSHAAIRSALPLPSDEPIVISEGIISSQGAGTAVPFALELIRQLVGSTIADEVAASIHA